MAFNLNLSPLVQGNAAIGRGLAGLGQTVGKGVARQRQAQQTEEANALMGAALAGNQDAMTQLMQTNPDAAMKIQDRLAQQQGNLDSEVAKETANRWENILAVPDDQKEALFNQYVNDPALDIDEEDRAFLTQPDRVKAFIGQVKGQDYLATAFPDSDTSGSPSSVRETEWFLKQTPEVQKKHIELKRKTDPTMAEKLELAQGKSDIKVEEAAKSTTEKGKAARQQGYIDSGIEAADSLGNIKRSMELLSSVETGGFDNVALRAKQLFGIESADEAELSAGLGKAILSQLKPIFGAAFTAAEGERLERIEANFGKSTEGNKRLLEQVMKITERAARRGLKAAKSSGDEFTASEIESLLSSGTRQEESPQSGQPKDKPSQAATEQMSDEDILKMYGG